MLQLEDEKGYLSAQAVSAWASAYGQFWQRQNLEPGTVVAVPAQHHRDFVLNILGLWQAGHVLLSFNPQLPSEVLATSLQEAGATCAVYPEKIAGMITLSGPDSQKLSPSGSWQAPPLEQAVSLIQTSGSSGKPKWVQHSWGNHVASAQASQHVLPLHAADSWLASLPFFHIGGLAIMVRCLLSGARLTLPSGTLSESLQRFQISHLSLVPVQWQDLLSQTEPKSLRAILLGGSAIPEALVKRSWEAHYPIHCSYGSTEMASQICTTPPQADLDTLLSAGPLLPGQSLRLDTDGRIWVKGKSLFMGYRLGQEWSRSLDSEGWFQTQDRGEWTPTQCLRVLGRLDQVLISGGENIQPEEIEALLLVLPGIRQAIVVGVPHARWGERPVAFIEGEWDENTLKSALSLTLPRFKIPDAFLPWPEQKGFKISRS